MSITSWLRTVWKKLNRNISYREENINEKLTLGNGIPWPNHSWDVFRCLKKPWIFPHQDGDLCKTAGCFSKPFHDNDLHNVLTLHSWPFQDFSLLKLFGFWAWMSKPSQSSHEMGRAINLWFVWMLLGIHELHVQVI